MYQLSKIVREWNGDLEIFSLPQVIENARKYLLFLTKKNSRLVPLIYTLL